MPARHATRRADGTYDLEAASHRSIVTLNDRNDLIVPIFWVAISLVLVIGAGYMLNRGFDFWNYRGCDKSDLCKIAAKANIAYETGMNIDAQGNLTRAPVVQTTVTNAPPVVLQQAPQPSAYIVQQAAPLPPQVIAPPRPQSYVVPGYVPTTYVAPTTLVAPQAYVQQQLPDASQIRQSVPHTYTVTRGPCDTAAGYATLSDGNCVKTTWVPGT